MNIPTTTQTNTQSPSKISVRELLEKLLSKEFTIDYCNHKCHDILPLLQRRFEHAIANSNGANDGKWYSAKELSADKIKEKDKNMREHIKSSLAEELVHGKPIEYTSLFPDETLCFCCGKELQPTLDIENKQILLNHHVLKYNLDKDNDIECLNDCDLRDLTQFTSIINISSDMILTNFFPDYVVKDEPEEFEHTPKWSLNHLAGRQRISQHLEQQNYAYGQLGNCYIELYISKNKDSIIICQELDETSPALKEYKHLGSICCDVWRWMATDVKTLTESNLAQFKKEYSHVNTHRVKTKHGKWKVQHFYDFLEDPYQPNAIWARLDLIKE